MSWTSIKKKMPDSFWEWLNKCPMRFHALSTGSHTTLHYAFRVPAEYETGKYHYNGRTGGTGERSV